MDINEIIKIICTWLDKYGYLTDERVGECADGIIALSKQGEDDRTYDPSQPTTNTKRVLIQRILELENLLSKQEPVKEKCKWAFDKDDSHYDTSCGQGYIFNYGEREPEFMFCPYCQKEIEEVKEN